MTPPTQTSASTEPVGVFGRGDAVWVALGLITFGAAMVVAYRPSLRGVEQIALTSAPWLVLLGMSTAFWASTRRLSTWHRVAPLVATMGAWAVLVSDDPRWSLLSFPLYALCFSVDRSRPLPGLILSGVVTVIWAGAWALSDTPTWTVSIPLFAFGAGATLYLAMFRTTQLAERQAALVRRLRATQDELAVSERLRGVLEERARMAGEIHDTLAQGFASIVLLARAAQKSNDSDTVASIESTAEEHLDAARRLVRSMAPPELESASLPLAIDRQVELALSDEIEAEFRVVGTPQQLTGAVEVTLLRAAQEALRNIRTHSRARRVDVTLEYDDGSVALRVRDDGIGFTRGEVAERGSLTGGQGLDALRQRTESLDGTLDIERNHGGGSLVSVCLPVEPSR